MANNNVKLSIIIPVFNTEKYIKECLDSILNIKVSNFEVIIIDDGSVDSSALIIKEFQKDFKNIFYFYQENSGQGAARNYGISVSNGEYIYFMDSDDIINSIKFTESFNYLEKANLDAFFFDGESFLDNSNNKLENNVNVSNFNYLRKRKYGQFNSGEDLYVELSRNKDFLVSPCLYIVKRDIYVKNDIKFPIAMKHEDEVFTMKMMFYIGSCIHNNEVLFLRRLRTNSTMTTINYNNTFLDHTKVLVYLNQFYEDYDFSNDDSKRFFLKKMRNIYVLSLKLFKKANQKELWPYYETLLSIGKKYQYFDKMGVIATKNITLFEYLSKLYLILK